MRQIITGMFITLDGVVEAPGTWNPPCYSDEMTQAVTAQTASAYTHLYGVLGRRIRRRWILAG